MVRGACGVDVLLWADGSAGRAVERGPCYSKDVVLRTSGALAGRSGADRIIRNFGSESAAAMLRRLPHREWRQLDGG